MKRREFIAFLGGAAAAPAVARAQDKLPAIGFLGVRLPADEKANGDGFHRGLAEHGYVEGQNVTIEYRIAGAQYERFPALAAELINRGVSVIVTTGGDPSALAAKAATSSIPIVFIMGSDSVKAGLVASYNRPGGNATGVDMLSNTLESKRLGLIHDLLPKAVAVGALINPNFPPSARQLSDLQDAARAFDLRIHELQARTDLEIDAAFEVVTQRSLNALVVAAEPFFNTRRNKILSLATRHAIPAMYQFREYVSAGGLMSYGIDIADTYRQVASYAGRILKGAKPSDLPVLQPTKFEFVLNLKTAKALGLEIPPMLLARADEVVE
jgi:putative ABC transport system substrate-binding protein